MALQKITAPSGPVLGSVNMEAYAVSSTTKDNTQAITEAVEAARATGYPLIGWGTYAYSTALNLAGVSIRGLTLRSLGTSSASKAINVNNTKLSNVTVIGGYLNHIGGDLVTEGLTVQNSQVPTAAVWSRNRTSSGKLELRNTTLTGVNYGVLVAGDSGSALTSIYIDGLRATNLRGDGVELNLIQSVVGGWTVRNVYIDGVVGTGTSNDFWGIGVGVAGATGYNPEAADELYARGGVLENINVKNCRQPIHLEKAKNFVVRNCDVWPTNAVNTTSGLVPCGVSLVGCTDFVVDGITGEPNVVASVPMITTSWGVVSGAYKGPCRNYSVRNVNTPGQIRLYSGATSTIDSYVALYDCKSGAGSFYKGYCSELRLENWRTSGLVLQIAHTSGEGVGIMTRNYGIKAYVVGVTSLSSAGVPDGSCSAFYVDELVTSNCNFSVRKQALGTGNRGSLVQQVQQHYLAPSTTFPCGQYFPAPSIVYRSDGLGMWIVTSSGWWVDAADAVKATVVGQTYLEANTGALNWASVNTKSAGMPISIAGAGAGGSALVTRVVRAPYVVGGVYRIDIADPVVTATADGTSISCPSPLTKIDITY